MINGFHIGSVIFIADMLEHANRNNMIKFLMNIPVILQSDFNRQFTRNQKANDQTSFNVIMSISVEYIRA